MSVRQRKEWAFPWETSRSWVLKGAFYQAGDPSQDKGPVMAGTDHFVTAQGPQKHSTALTEL